MVDEQFDKLKAETFFLQLSNLSFRFTKMCYRQRKRVLSEYDYQVGDSPFSQIEINRILSTKK